MVWSISLGAPWVEVGVARDTIPPPLFHPRGPWGASGGRRVRVVLVLWRKEITQNCGAHAFLVGQAELLQLQQTI